MPRVDWLKGIFPAIVTPFDKEEKLDEERLRALVDHLMDDVDGFVVAGTTGEFVYMNDDERTRAIEVVVDHVDGTKPVIAGTGASSTKNTISLTQKAMDVGADAALVVTPYYFKPSWNEIYKHYEKLDQLGYPLILYNIPQCAGVHQKWWTTEGLSYLDNVIGVKDSSGDIPYTAALFEKVREKVNILVGNDEVGMAAIGEGADGAILASANLIPDYWQDVYRYVQEGELEKARQLQQKMQKLVRIVVRTGGVQAVKDGLWMMGVDVGKARRPTMPGDSFQHEDREELRIELENLGKIESRKTKYILGPDRVIETSVPATPQTPEVIDNFSLRVGEGYAGPPHHEVAHTDLLIGLKDGPVEKAIENALEVDDGGKMRIVIDRPRTLLVPTITPRTSNQKDLIYNHAVEGLKWAVDASIEDGFLPDAILDDIVIIANVFVHPAAANKRRVMVNNYKGARYAIRKALENRPTEEEIQYQKQSVRHPFKYTP